MVYVKSMEWKRMKMVSCTLFIFITAANAVAKVMYSVGYVCVPTGHRSHLTGPSGMNIVFSAKICSI